MSKHLSKHQIFENKKATPENSAADFVDMNQSMEKKRPYNLRETFAQMIADNYLPFSFFSKQSVRAKSILKKKQGFICK